MGLFQGDPKMHQVFPFPEGKFYSLVKGCCVNVLIIIIIIIIIIIVLLLSLLLLTMCDLL